MTIENEKKKIKDFSQEIKKKILKMAYVAGAHSSHLGGALSIVDIISFLFCNYMNIKKNVQKCPSSKM